MPNLRRVGRLAEDLAAETLLGKGLTIVTRRFTVRGGEKDIIALDGDTLAFVEMRCRNAPGFSPEETVGATKQAKMRRAASAYLEFAGERERDVRFEMVAVSTGEVRHIPDAFHFD